MIERNFFKSVSDSVLNFIVKYKRFILNLLLFNRRLNIPTENRNEKAWAEKIHQYLIIILSNQAEIDVVW